MNPPFFEVSIRSGHGIAPTLFDVTNFLYDLNVGYEIARLAVDNRYEEFRFSHNLFFRRGRPLANADRLRTVRLSLESPFEMVVAVTAVGAATAVVWGIVRLVEKAVTLPATIRKARADAEKAEAEAREARERVGQDLGSAGETAFHRRLLYREAEPFFRATQQRLSENGIVVEEVTIRLVRRRRG